MLLWKIGGIRIKVNFLWFLLCGIYGLLGFYREILLIFAAVMIHETAHTITALVLQVKVTEIELWPFGGQAKVEDITGMEPDKEIYIALAGPVTSLSLAGIFFWGSEQINSAYLPLFININLYLGLFNLCPALPMDGGRILRAMLSGKIGFKKATAGMAGIGKCIAVLILGYGGYQAYLAQYQGINFIIAGSLLFWAARRESQLLAYAFMRYLVNKRTDLSRHGVLPCLQVVSRADTRLKTILDMARPNFYLLVVMIDENDRPLGMRSEAEIIEAYLNGGPGMLLRDC